MLKWHFDLGASQYKDSLTELFKAGVLSGVAQL